MTKVEKENISYLIDRDGDGKWDHAYNNETGLLTYYDYLYMKYYEKISQDTPGFELISLLAMIAIVMIIYMRRKKTGEL